MTYAYHIFDPKSIISAFMFLVDMYFEGVHHLQTKHDDKIKPVPGHPLPMEQNK